MTTAADSNHHLRLGTNLAGLGRVAGATWFLLLAAFYGAAMAVSVQNALATGGFTAWAQPLSRLCTVGFFLILAGLMITRRATLARREGVVPSAVSLLGTYGVWAVAFLPEAHLSPALAALSTAITLVGSLLIIWTILHLGRSFSIAPQARALITTGPYRLVRHPLYVAEEIALIGVAMHVDWRVAGVFLAAHVGLQFWRMRYEEAILASVFTEYDAYARRTARWIPGLW